MHNLWLLALAFAAGLSLGWVGSMITRPPRPDHAVWVELYGGDLSQAVTCAALGGGGVIHRGAFSMPISTSFHMNFLPKHWNQSDWQRGWWDGLLERSGSR